MRIIAPMMIFLMLTSTLAGCFESDSDGDGLNDADDNCPDIDNPLQADHDISGGLDGGNECDEDDDNDGKLDIEDDCPVGDVGWNSSIVEFDSDSDGCRDSTEDLDLDNDGKLDIEDDCPVGDVGWDSSIVELDSDSDGCRDSTEDLDDDNDGWTDLEEIDCESDKNQFISIPNDMDSDGICDTLDSSHAPIFFFNNMSDWYREDSSIFFSAIGFDYDNDILDFTWFFGDGSIGYGDSVNHLYEEVGDYLVTLTVSDGTYNENISNNIKVVSIDAREPYAHIQEYKDHNCDGDLPPSGTFVLIWICEEREINDRDIEISTSIYLNGSTSWAGCDPNDSNCYAEEFIVSYEWT